MCLQKINKVMIVSILYPFVTILAEINSFLASQLKSKVNIMALT